MKKYTLFVVFFVSYFSTLVKVFSQSDNNKFLNPKTLSEADSAYYLAEKYEKSNEINKALKLYISCVNVYFNYKKYKKLGDCYFSIGTINYFNGDNTQSLNFLNKCLTPYRNAKYKKGEVNVLNNIGAIYYNMGNYLQAIDYYSQALYLQESIGDKYGTATIIANIGGIYSKLEDYTNAIKYFKKANSIFKVQDDKIGIAKILIETGYVFMKQSNYSKAYEDFNKAYEIAHEEKDKDLVIESLANLGELFYTQSDYERSLYYYNQCLKLAEKIDNLNYKSRARISIGTVLVKKNRFKEAEEKCQLGYTYAKQLKALALQEEACNCLYNSYKSMGKSQLALSYYENATGLKDSLKIEETQCSSF